MSPQGPPNFKAIRLTIRILENCLFLCLYSTYHRGFWPVTRTPRHYHGFTALIDCGLLQHSKLLCLSSFVTLCLLKQMLRDGYYSHSPKPALTWPRNRGFYCRAGTPVRLLPSPQAVGMKQLNKIRSCVSKCLNLSHIRCNGRVCRQM